MREIVDRLVGVACVVLDRASGKAGGLGREDSLRRPLGAVALAALEVGRNRQVGRRGHLAAMVDHGVECHRPVRQSAGKGKAGAGGGQRLEAKGGQQLGRADIPGVGYHESRGMQVAKDLALVHGSSPPSRAASANSIAPPEAGQTNAIGSEAFGVLCCQFLECVRVSGIAGPGGIPPVGDGNLVRRRLGRGLVTAFAARRRCIGHRHLERRVG